jgi:hypothetical protein
MKYKILCFLALLPISAIAQMQPAQLAQFKMTLDQLEQGDTDKNGSTSLEEVKVIRTKEFATLAAGKAEIDPETLQAPPQMRAMMLSNMDKDGNGKLSETEFVNGLPPIWSRLDQNGDNQISQQEIGGARAMLAGMGG